MDNRPLPAADSWRFVESRWDLTAYWLLTALLSFMPLALGAVEAWSELIVAIGSGLLIVGTALRLVCDPTFRLAKTWAYAPLAAILVLTLWQLCPLPEELLKVVSPESARLRAELLGDAASTTQSDYAPLSLYPLETTHDLRMALVFIALFTTVAATFRDTQQIKRLLATVFVIGCVEAAVALLQIATFSNKVLWLTAERGQVITSGSFINYSHFCQFVNLCLGAGVGLLLVRMREDDRRSTRRDESFSVSRYGPRNWEKYAPHLAGIVLCNLAVLTSMSRNGVLSLLAGIAVACLLLRLRGRISTRGWLLVTAPAAVLVLLLLTRLDVVYERMATLEKGDALEGRLEMTAGVLRAWSDFPLFGAGLGTHEYIFPLYDEAVTPSVAEHADNDWAQLLEEFGLAGAAAVVALLAVVATGLGKLILRGRTSLATASFGLAIGFIAAAIHSFSDFGQHLPAVFSMTAVLCGLVIAIRDVEGRNAKRRRSSPPRQRQNESSRALRIFFFAAVTSVYLWSCVAAYAAWRAEQWATASFTIESELLESQWVGEEQTYIDLIAAAEQAFQWQPRDVRLGYQLNVYRWRSVSQAAQQQGGDLVLAAEAIPWVEQIVDALAQVRTLCPTYGPPYGLEGELRRLVLGQPRGRELIAHAARLAPYHWPSCLLAGELAAREGDPRRARELLDRAVLLNPSLYSTVAQLYIDLLGAPEAARQLAGDDYQRLGHLAELFRTRSDGNSGYEAAATAIEAEALGRLEQQVASGEATSAETARLASIRVAQGDHEQGIQLYRKALAGRYAEVRWRLALARSLEEVGEIRQAIRELKIVLRLKPGHAGAKESLGRLSVLPEAGP